LEELPQPKEHDAVPEPAAQERAQLSSEASDGFSSPA